MNILETIDTYVNALIAFRTKAIEDNIQSLEADVNNKYEVMKSELEKADINSLRKCADALNEAIDSKRLEIDALLSRYTLGVTQKNVAIINNNPFSEKRYDNMIEETLAQAREVEALSDGYKEALNEVTMLLTRGRN